MAFTIMLNPAWASEMGIAQHTYTWSIQDKKPVVVDFSNARSRDNYLYRVGVRVDLLQAEGDELALINLKFEHLPTCNRDIVVWRGDMASFIFNNL